MSPFFELGILQVLSVFLAVISSSPLVSSSSIPLGTKFTWQAGSTLPADGFNVSTVGTPGGRSFHSFCADDLGLWVYGGYALAGPPNYTCILSCLFFNIDFFLIFSHIFSFIFLSSTFLSFIF